LPTGQHYPGRHADDALGIKKLPTGQHYPGRHADDAPGIKPGTIYGSGEVTVYVILQP